MYTAVNSEPIPYIIKKKNGEYIKVGIDNLGNFLFFLETKPSFLPSVRLVPGLDFSAIPVSISAVSLGRLSTYILFTFKCC